MFLPAAPYLRVYLGVRPAEYVAPRSWMRLKVPSVLVSGRVLVLALELVWLRDAFRPVLYPLAGFAFASPPAGPWPAAVAR